MIRILSSRTIGSGSDRKENTYIRFQSSQKQPEYATLGQIHPIPKNKFTTKMDALQINLVLGWDPIRILYGAKAIQLKE